MRATKKTAPKPEAKTQEAVNFLDRHTFHWFVDTKTNALKTGKSFSSFLNNETESFPIKAVHACDEKYWKLAETADGRFILLSRPKLLK